MRVLMLPTLQQVQREESGVRRVIEFWHKYGTSHGIDFVDCKVDEENLYDVFCVHAGSSNVYPMHRPIVAVCHGVYWTADYNASRWEWKTNSSVIESLRRATLVTVPSRWVAETIMRDARIVPFIIPHGIEADFWMHDWSHSDYVLWNKNRVGDVCNPEPIGVLAKRFPGTRFFSTFLPEDAPPNIAELGVIDHAAMRNIIQKAFVYLSTTKETFGIGILEALASGVPVLGFAYGGNNDLVIHKETGYLAKPGDYDDLAYGLRYCMKFHDIISENARLDARRWNWEYTAQLLKKVFNTAFTIWQDQQRERHISEALYRIDQPQAV